MDNVNEQANYQLGQLYQQSEGNPEIVVAIIDGAIDGKHADFSQADLKILDNEQQTTAAQCAIADGPSCQHGTFIAGILAANRDSEAPGICPQCTFIAKPIFCEADSLSDCPAVTQIQLAGAVNDCVDAGADIINMSIGLSGQSQNMSTELTQAYDNAKSNGVLLIGASGNQSSNQVNSLFAHPWVIAVSAIDNHGQILPSANQGQWITQHGLLAPGEKIVSTAAGGGYRQMTGTSAAAPFVTGTAALLWSLAPKLAAQSIYDALMHNTNLATREQLTLPLTLNGETSLSLLNQSSDQYYQDTYTMTETTAVPNTPQSTLESHAPLIAPSNLDISPQSCSCQSQSDISPAPSFAYAVGTLKPIFPDQGVQQAFDCAAQQLKVSEQDYYDVFSFQDPKTKLYPYLYIAAQTQWVLNIDSLDHYLVIPRSIVELQQCIAALKPQQNTLQAVYSTVVGLIGPVAVYGEHQSLLPTILSEQVFSQTMDELHDMLQSFTGVTSDAIQDVIKQLEMTPNAGDSDFARAKNYLAFRYPEIYQHTHKLKNNSEGSAENGSYFLANIECSYADIKSPQTVVDVIFTYQKNSSNQQKNYYCSVDVSGCFPFISMALQPFTPLTMM